MFEYDYLVIIIGLWLVFDEVLGFGFEGGFI